MAKWPFNSPPDSDTRRVITAASLLHASEFEVFQLAYERWFGHPAEGAELERLFGHYLSRESVPVWVRDFARQVQQREAEGRLDVREFGIEPPPNVTYWTAFLGGMGFAVILMLVALVLYFAIVGGGMETSALSCRFPPCY